MVSRLQTAGNDFDFLEKLKSTWINLPFKIWLVSESRPVTSTATSREDTGK